MKKYILLFLILPFCPGIMNAQSTCGNRDFEDTTFVNWSGATGMNQDLTNPINWTSGIITGGINTLLGDSLSRHTLITQNFLDSNCIDPITMTYDTYMTSLAPGGGTVSLRLGNTRIGSEIEKLSIPFVVSSGNQILTYQYACVQNDPGHPWEAQPFFMVNLRDALGNPLSVGCDTIYAGQQNVPFIVSTNGNNYRRWTPVSVDLSAYIGQTITVEFINSDCAYAGHWGYTYLDVSCLGALAQNVWPGDADYDLECNYVDVLSLAIAFGSTGPARTTPGNTWAASPSTDWSTAFPLGANYKHSDCDGNGIVDFNDLNAVIANYGNTHPFKPAQGNTTQHHAKTASLPTLQMTASASNVGPSNNVTFNINAGSGALPVQNLYGIAFAVEYPENLIQSGFTQGNYNNNWLGVNNQNLISLFQSRPGDGRSEFVLARTTHQDTTGNGILASFQLRTLQNPTSITPLILNIKDVYAIDENMAFIPLQTTACTVYIDPSLPANVYTDADQISFQIYPNPAQDWLFVQGENTESAQLNIINLLGEIISTHTLLSGENKIEIQSLSAGLYRIEMIQGNKRSVKSFSKF